MNNQMFLGFIYIIIFLACFVITFKMISESNFSKLFKQGQVTYIRFSYIIISFIIAYLFSSSITRFIEAVYDIVLV